MNIFAFIHRHARALLFTILVFTVAGVALMMNMPVSLFPDVTFPRIVILADNGEEPAERMMVEVTKPLEEVASSLPDVRVVRSVTSRGSTEISVGLRWGSDVQQTLQLLQGRIANIRSSLPSAVQIQTEQMRVTVFPILGYSLTSDTLDPVELRDIALYQIRPALLRVPGVASVEITGGDIREFLVDVSPEKLARYHLEIDKVTAAIRNSNLVASTGLIDNNHQLYISLVSGLLKTTDDIRSVVIASPGGIPVRIEDVATVRPSVADKLIRTTAHGKDAVLINIIKQPIGSTVEIGRDVQAEVSRLRLPPGIHFENFYDQGDFIRSSILATRDSIIIGILLAMLVLFVVLRSWRTTLVIMLVVPATLAATFGCLYAAGKSINIMTLGGVAAAVGLIIDDSIVIIEHIFTQFSKSETGIAGGFVSAANRSIRELMPAILGSTASTIVIHIPLAFLGGVTGAFFASLSVTMVFAMSISFLFSISLAPLLASRFLRQTDIDTEVAREQRPSRFAGAYRRLLEKLLRFRLAVIPASLLLLGAVWFLYNHIGTGFMPDMDEGTFVLDYITPPGTSLTETNRMLMQIERILMSTPEVESYSRRTGTQLGFFLTEPNTGDYLVKLRKSRTRGIEDVISEVREKIEESQPAIQIDFGQLMMDVIGDLTNNPSPVEIKIFGEDTGVLQAKAREVKTLIENVPGIVDAFDGIVISGPSFIVHVDPLRASEAGFTADDIRQELETIMRGNTESTIQKGEKLIPIHVRYPEAYRTDIDKIASLMIVNSAGTAVPLRNVATIERTVGQAEIRRERLRQMVAVTARISGRDLGRTVADIQQRLASHLVLPQGMTMEFGGVYQTQQESFLGLLIVAIVAFLLVAIVLMFEFGDLAVPLSILVVNILSLVGVFGALWLAGETFNISSFVGIIMIIGIVAENAIFVMHQVRVFRAQGESLDTALIEAVIVRARPIMMTTLAAVLALLPLALGIGTGAQMQRPLAIAVIGGFSVSSLLLFFGLPLVYRIFRTES